jgi:hypothetical protein
LTDINGDFLPPAEAAVQVQGMVDRGRKRSPHWPHDPVSKWYQMPWAPSVVQDGLNNFGSVYGFLIAWFRWGIMSLCLVREADGSRYWSIGQFLTYFFLLLKVGHEATKDPDLHGMTVVTFVQKYDIALRSHFHHLTSTRQNFDLNDFLKDTRDKTYRDVKLAYLRSESDKKKQRASDLLSRQNGSQQQSDAPRTTARNSFRGGRSSGPGSRNLQPAPKQETVALDPRVAKPRPTPHSIPTLCRNWEANGTCEYGSTCIFQHSAEEKRGAKRPGDESARTAKRERP